MSSDDNSESNLETQIGANDIDTRDIDLESETEFVEFELEPEPVFRELATGIYEADSAGLREPLLNAITAVLEAQRDHSLSDQNGIVEVTVERGEESDTLIIQDNGVGVTESRLKKAMAIIGKSLNRDNPNIAGKFGIGFLALWILVGLNGGFEMYSRSRKTDQQIAGIWKSGGFVWDKSDELQKLGKNQYGTRFEVPLRQEFSATDIRGWIDELARYSRVPVKYSETEPNGSIVFEEDYGIESLEDQLPDDVPQLVIETEYYKVVTSKQSNNETILLDVPIKRNEDYISSLPFHSFDIRLKKENAVVVNGPNEGQMVVSQNEYTQFSSERKESYISERDLTEEDIVLPSPVGTRDSLSRNYEFWEYIAEQINRVYKQRVKKLYDQISCLEDLFTLPVHHQQLLLHSCSHLKNFNSSLKKSLNEEIDVSLSTTFASQMKLLPREILYAPSKTENISQSSNMKKATVWKIEKQRRNLETGEVVGDVYMGVTLNQTKANVVWEDNSNSQVARVQSTDNYNEFEELLNWKKLKDISKENIAKFNIPTHLHKKFIEPTEKSSNKPVEEKSLTLHFEPNSKTTTDISLRTIKQADKNSSNDERLDLKTENPYYLVIFPPNSDAKISENYHLADESVGLANCSQKEFEYLQSCDKVFTLQEFTAVARDTEVLTSSGEMKVKDLPDDSVFHIVTGYESLFKDTERLTDFEKYVRDDVLVGDDFFTPEQDSVTYVPVTTKELAKIRPYITEDTPIINGEHKYEGIGDLVVLENNTRIYAFARLSEWQNTTEMNVLENINIELHKTGYDFVETLGELHDAGKSPHSQR